MNVIVGFLLIPTASVTIGVLALDQPVAAYVHPLRAGVVVDFEVADAMIKHFIAKAPNRCSVARAQIVVCVPVGTTAVELCAFRKSVESAGARKI